MALVVDRSKVDKLRKLKLDFECAADRIEDAIPELLDAAEEIGVMVYIEDALRDLDVQIDDVRRQFDEEIRDAEREIESDVEKYKRRMAGDWS